VGKKTWELASGAVQWWTAGKSNRRGGVGPVQYVP
jgi:hypothetical protein